MGSGGISFFHLAAELGNEEVIKLLIACNPRPETLHATFNDGKSKDDEGLNALQIAIKYARDDKTALSLVQELMKGKIKEGRTYAQKFAQKCGFTETANFLAAQINSKSRSSSESEADAALRKYRTALLLKSRTSSVADVSPVPASSVSQLDVKGMGKPKTSPAVLNRDTASHGEKFSTPIKAAITTEFHPNPAGFKFSSSPLKSPIVSGPVQAAIPLLDYKFHTPRRTS